VNPFSWYRMLYWRFRWYVFPRRRYTTRCQCCGVPTGRTLHAWATKDICVGCAAFEEAAYVTALGENPCR